MRPRGGLCERGQSALWGRHWHGAVALGAVCARWSTAALGSGKGQEVAVSSWLPPRYGERGGDGLLRRGKVWPATMPSG